MEYDMDIKEFLIVFNGIWYGYKGVFLFLLEWYEYWSVFMEWYGYKGVFLFLVFLFLVEYDVDGYVFNGICMDI